MRRQTYAITCDGKTMQSLPVGFAEYRICQATGEGYYTVDADPNDCCPNHTKAEVPEAA